MKTRNFGDNMAVVALVLGIFALASGLLAIIPILGLVFAVITFIFAILSMPFAIIGTIKAASKGKAITALVFDISMLTWAIIRYFWVVGLLATAAAA